VAVLTLALGIAANATVFSWIDAVLLRPIPGVAAADQLVAIETQTPTGNNVSIPYRDYRDYRDNLKLVSGSAASLMNAYNIGPDDSVQRIWGEYVSGNYFEVLGVRASRGRVFGPEEYGDAVSAYPVVVISHRLWLRMFHSDPKILGKTLRVNRYELTIVGVAPKEFFGTVPGVSLELWIPFVMAPQINGQGDWLLNSRNDRHVNVVARLKPGVSISQCREEVAAMNRQIAQDNPKTSAGFTATVEPMWKAHSGAQSLLLDPLRILMAVCVVLLLIVGANVANLQLARATARQKEFGIRLALGAGPLRIARQVLTESLMLASAGAIIGLLLSQWMVDTLSYLVPPIGIPFSVDVQPNITVLAFTILICMAASLVSGLAPALHAVRSNFNETLKEGGRGSSSGVSLNRMRGLLVVAEVALALVALVGTGLFARSFYNARSVSLGFEPQNVLLAQFHVATFCRTSEQRMQFAERLRERLKSAPGVTAVTYSNYYPLQFGSSPVATIQVEGYTPAVGEDMRVGTSKATPGYLDALRIPLIEGRDFNEHDDSKSLRVIIVNESFARRFFAGRNPVGRKVRTYGEWYTVIGMVKDAKYERPVEPPMPYFYATTRQQSSGEFWFAFLIRTDGPPSQSIPMVRREAAAVDPAAATFVGLPLEESITQAVFGQRVAASLLGVLGAICLVLAAVGLYSVMAYAVSQRTHELGIRMALGAQPRAVFGMVVRQGMLLTVAGLLVGVVIAFASARLVAEMLIRVSAGDPLTFSVAAVFLGLVSLLANYMPARRATKVDPISALRCE
jgi:predicted permease